MNSLKISKDINYRKVKDTIYIAELDEQIMNKTISDIVESFTITKVDKFSPLMDMLIVEELISRIIADGFINKHEDILNNNQVGIVISYSIGDLNYKVSVAKNMDELGGIVYGIQS